jgi:hypothetical protein
MMLAFTVVTVSIVINSVNIMVWMLVNPDVIFVSILVKICCLLFLFCNRDLARRVPHNYILLGLFTVCKAITVSYICKKSSCRYDADDYGRTDSVRVEHKDGLHYNGRDLV